MQYFNCVQIQPFADNEFRYTTTDHRETNCCWSRCDQLTTLRTYLFPKWPPDQPTVDMWNYCHWGTM